MDSEFIAYEMLRLKREMRLSWGESRDLILLSQLQEINRNLGNIDLSLSELLKK